MTREALPARHPSLLPVLLALLVLCLASKNQFTGFASSLLCCGSRDSGSEGTGWQALFALLQLLHALLQLLHALSWPALFAAVLLLKSLFSVLASVDLLC